MRDASGSCAEKRREEKNSPSSLDALFDADRQDVTDLCHHLAERIESNGSKRPTIGKTWMTEARRMIDLDRRDPNEAHRLIDWCQDDSFWRTNVLSMPKFREQYDKIRLRSATTRPSEPPAAAHGMTEYDILRIRSTGKAS